MNLSHTPIVSVDYEHFDVYGDAKYLSIGWATWSPHPPISDDDNGYSAKIFRLLHEGEETQRWSRQSEELPLWRVLDLAILVVSQITGKETNCFNVELAGKPENLEKLNRFLAEHKEALYDPRLRELRRLLQD